MRRLLSTLTVVVTLPLALAFVVLWVRSYFVWDSVFLETQTRPHMIESAGGRIGWSQPCGKWGPTAPQWGRYRFTGRAGTVLEDVAKNDASAYAWGGFIVALKGTNFTRRAVATPYWLLILLTGVPGAFLVRARRKRRRRIAMGQCEQCGYDLRATPQRCPECGATPRAVAV